MHTDPKFPEVSGQFHRGNGRYRYVNYRTGPYAALRGLGVGVARIFAVGLGRVWSGEGIGGKKIVHHG